MLGLTMLDDLDRTFRAVIGDAAAGWMLLPKGSLQRPTESLSHMVSFL
jgi:hypothetical protein